MAISKEDFERRFRGRMLNFFTEAWTMRNAKPSDIGFLMDSHDRRLRALLSEMYDFLYPPEKPPANHQPAKPAQTQRS